jgi:sporulation protein YlmC with PRC-barrel domain
MRLSLKQLKTLHVETTSGQTLGKIHDLILDIDSQSILQYEVRASMIGGKEYLISRDSIIRFEETKMVVDDNIKPISSKEEKTKLTGMTPKPIAMRQHD